MKRNSAGLIIEDVEFEAVEAAGEMGCSECAFKVPAPYAACKAHACMPTEFPKGHPLHLWRAIWVRKTT